MASYNSICCRIHLLGALCTTWICISDYLLSHKNTCEAFLRSGARLVNLPWPYAQSLTRCLLPFRAATLVRRTKGENRRGKSHPLRCDRQRWYGGTRGRETGESAAKQLLTRDTTSSHSAHPPTFTAQLLRHFSFLFLFLAFLLSTHISCLFLVMVDRPVHAFAGLCPPVDSCLKHNLFRFLNCMTAECREMVQLKTTKWNPGQKTKPLSFCQLFDFRTAISKVPENKIHISITSLAKMLL